MLVALEPAGRCKSTGKSACNVAVWREIVLRSGGTETTALAEVPAPAVDANSAGVIPFARTACACLGIRTAMAAMAHSWIAASWESGLEVATVLFHEGIIWPKPLAIHSS